MRDLQYANSYRVLGQSRNIKGLGLIGSDAKSTRCGLGRNLPEHLFAKNLHKTFL